MNELVHFCEEYQGASTGRNKKIYDSILKNINDLHMSSTRPPTRKLVSSKRFNWNIFRYAW